MQFPVNNEPFAMVRKATPRVLARRPLRGALIACGSYLILAGSFCGSFLAFAQIASGATWIESLPPIARKSILWWADHESGTLNEWNMPQFKYPGGGIFNTGKDDVSARASQVVAHSGVWSASAKITQAVRAENGKRAVRLMRWTNRAWDDEGGHFPDAAYYSTWAYFPQVYNPNKSPPWDPGDGGWWNIFQFKSEDQNGESQPMWTLNVEHDDSANTMSVYLYSKYNDPASYSPANHVVLPQGQWVHLEAFYRSATGKQGEIKIWQDGQLILEAKHVVTSLGGKTHKDTHPIWGIGNYTDHITGDPAGVGTATVYFDDSIVSTRSISPYAKPDVLKSR